MATQYAGGGRRSVAPEYSPRAVFGTPAINGQDQIAQQLLTAMNEPAYAGSGTSSYWSDGGSGGMETAPSTTGGTQGLNQMAAFGGVLGSLGALNQDASLAEAGKTVGQAAGAISLGSQLSQAQSISDVGRAIASNPAALSALGLPGQVAGALAGSVKGGVEGAVTSLGKGAVYGAVPALGLVDATLSLMGVQTLADRVISAISGAATGGWQSGDVNGGVNAGGVTVGGPMGPGTVEGTPLGPPTGPEVSFDFGLGPDGGEGTDSNNGSDRGPGGSSGDADAAAAGADASGPGTW